MFSQFNHSTLTAENIHDNNNSYIEPMDYNLNIHNSRMYVNSNSTSYEELLMKVDNLSLSESVMIKNVWSEFSRASSRNQNLLLEGLLYRCCFPQLSILSNKIKKLNRTDFFESLPQEISLQILSYLDAISLCKVARVSKKWRELADDNAIWKRICVQHIDKKCNECGWGLPLLENSDDSDDSDCEDDRMIIWKQIYSRRFVVERNWRKGRCNVKVLEGHDDGITCLQLKKELLITGSYDHTVRIWSIETGKTLGVLRGHTNCVKALQFNDLVLATASLDRTIKLWNYKKGTCIRTLCGHTAGVISLHFINNVLVSGSADTTIKVWNFTSGQHYTLVGHMDSVNRVIIYKDTQVLSSSDDGTIRTWDILTESCLRVFEGHVGGVPCMEFASLSVFSHILSSIKLDNNDDLPIIVSGSLDNTIKVWCAQSGKCCSTLFGHVEGIWALALNSLRMVTGSQDKTVKVWDKNTGVCLHTLKGHEGPVTCIALSDTKVVTGSDDKKIRIWDFNV